MVKRVSKQLGGTGVDNTGSIHVDATNKRLGLNNDSPSETLDVTGNVIIQNANIIFNPSTQEFSIQVVGNTIFSSNTTAIKLTSSFDTNNNTIIFPSTSVTDVLDEDDLSSDSASALATQQSIKAYVDSATGGSSIDQTARNRINSLSFRLASLNSLAVFEMTDMVLDAFEDETGVEVNNGATYDAAGDYYDNPGAFTDGPTATLDTNLPTFDNYTAVQIIDAAEFSSNSSQVRVTFEGGTVEGFRIESAWIGHPPGAGDVYDFDGNQVQLQFSGNDHVEIAASTTATSDAANFDLDASKNLLIAFEIQKSIGTNNDTLRGLTSKTNWSAYLKVVQGDTGTTDKTGYSASAHNVMAVNKIEVLGVAENITLISDEYTADASPDTARTTIWLDAFDPVTINTDATAYASRASATFTTDYATDANQIDDVAHGLSDDDRVAVFSNGTLPAGLTEGVLYYVVNSTTDAFELSTSSGGAAVTLTDDGSGTHTWAVFDAVTLVEDVAYDADVTIYAADVDISGQPSGTAMRWAFATANNKEQQLHGFALSWR